MIERALSDLQEQGLDRDDHLAEIVRITASDFGAGGGASIPIPEHLPPGAPAGAVD